jgi:CRP/FNR family transcriptional regulator
MGIVEQLRDCYLCSELNQSELESLADIVVISRHGKGAPLFWEGDKAAGFYVLLSGSIRIYKSSRDGKEITIHQIRPGQMFAEAAIFAGDRYPANCAALTESVVAFFPKTAFLKLLEDSPTISFKMIAALSAFVREFNQMVESLSLKEVSARLASHLLDESSRNNSDHVSIETTKAELANKLGTISETLSRNLKKLMELKVIAVDRQDITILDRARLQSIADGEKI